MEATRGQAKQNIPLFDVSAIDQLFFLDHAHGKPRQIILAGLVKPGHFGRLAAEQSTAGLSATLGHPLDDGGHLFRIEPA